MNPAVFGLVTQVLELFLNVAAVAATKGNCAQSADLVKGVKAAYELIKLSMGEHQ